MARKSKQLPEYRVVPMGREFAVVLKGRPGNGLAYYASRETAQALADAWNSGTLTYPRRPAAEEEARAWFMGIETQLRKETGIHTLRMGYAEGMGYYAEVTDMAAQHAGWQPPAEWRASRFSPPNAKRYRGPELAEKERIVMGTAVPTEVQE
jgi:hypothetical protein